MNNSNGAEGRYSSDVMDHFLNPRNMGILKNHDAKGQVGNPVCGDMMVLYIKVGKKKGEEYLKDVKFQTLGCGAAIATSSILTEMAKGKTLKEAVKIGKTDVTKALGGLPPEKVHCSNLASDALKKAIKAYQKKS